ncbi:MAG TPA: hypothetical protein VEB39_01550 [Sphingomicrobium sp.]|nr:hypothetical protein [Sphingomicrobium sp.]
MAQAQGSLPKEVLLEKARHSFDNYMLGEFEAASLARIQKAAFPDNWNRMRENFANTATDKLQGKIGQAEAQQRYAQIIQQSFAEVEAEIEADRATLARAPLPQLVTWESALAQQVTAHLAVNPKGCTLAAVLQKPATPADTMTKLDLVGAYWNAYGQAKAAPVSRQLGEFFEGDIETLDSSLAAAGMPDASRHSIVRSGKLVDFGGLGCKDRLTLSKVLLSIGGDVQGRLLAHAITRAEIE